MRRFRFLPTIVELLVFTIFPSFSWATYQGIKKLEEGSHRMAEYVWMFFGFPLLFIAIVIAIVAFIKKSINPEQQVIKELVIFVALIFVVILLKILYV